MFPLYVTSHILCLLSSFSLFQLIEVNFKDKDFNINKKVNYNNLPQGLEKCHKPPLIFINDTPPLEVLIYIANNAL